MKRKRQKRNQNKPQKTVKRISDKINDTKIARS